MSKKRRNQKRADAKITSAQQAWVMLGSDEFNKMICAGYTTLDHNAEVVTACRMIATLIASMTIHLMANTDKGDQRIVNELSRKVDIDPNPYMTRSTLIEMLVMNMIMYEKIQREHRIDIFDASVFACVRYLENLERKKKASAWWGEGEK